MKKYMNIFVTGFALLGFFSACNDNNFLNVDPSIETPEQALSSPTAATELVNSIYNKFLDWNESSFSWNGVSSITTDDADKGSDPGDTGGDKDLLDALSFSSTSLSFNEVWEANYQGIARANQALKFLPQLDLDATLKTQLIGESKFLRALFYFRLVRMFGGVPLIKSVPNIQNQDDINAANTRATKQEVYDFIMADLAEAATNLPINYGSNDLGRATKGAALTLLAKVNMYQGNWQNVKDLTNQVMSLGYSLTTDYADIWKEIGENNSESIFEIQARGETPNKGVQGYFVSQGARGAGGWGWGFNTPTQNLADAYEPNDARKDATIIFRGETLWDGLLVANTVSNPMYNQKAYVSKTNETFNGNDWESNKNIRVLRYAEVLLMNAEACLKVGGDAATPLNAVRNRAGLGNAPVVDEMAVWKERRVELAFEHDRYFDLVRQGRAGTVLRAHGKNFVDGKNELFPIPQTQIALSGGLLIQNPGY
ncbi:MAG: RagB/SusD family nutrient uptake outer membrane protein [Flavobacteriales bacterium CG_4_9_14_0_2_um_filter_35_242]|nr:RagB/SusD family nutrient uptake outer membrane protein [Flavobacteriales bacterium]OIO09605.1 MAG: RagB/SusD family nutrient uptake outer membrane protein [Flavobacteriaceae bacterium CG1_02_35_72]PJA05282.1 MAG: RagB/SusD family nutrient uptake outer membrane protein [Flavobacteriales bacterium CG_4_10_14_0_2_um_filter_35_18]PJC59623.1 MAG: RagB/SusD family nutrient uptake outer membrane protein [Flavobacteriales bacterium CG_4_9_14_0_2_um_filter_35_242]